MLAVEIGGQTAAVAVENYSFTAYNGTPGDKQEAFWRSLSDVPSDLAIGLLLFLPGALLAFLTVLAVIRFRRQSAELNALGPNWGCGWLAFLLFHVAWAWTSVRLAWHAEFVFWSVPLLGAGLTMAVAYQIETWLHLKASKNPAR